MWPPSPQLSLPFTKGKKQSISTLLRECEMHRALLGTRPSCGGFRSVVRTRHQPGLSLGRSSSSTVCPTWMLSSLLWPALKSWRTTVSSHPPESFGDGGRGVKCEGEKMGKRDEDKGGMRAERRRKKRRKGERVGKGRRWGKCWEQTGRKKKRGKKR